jgi:hypothetical protein
MANGIGSVRFAGLNTQKSTPQTQQTKTQPQLQNLNTDTVSFSAKPDTQQNQSIKK